MARRGKLKFNTKSRRWLSSCHFCGGYKGGIWPIFFQFGAFFGNGLDDSNSGFRRRGTWDKTVIFLMPRRVPSHWSIALGRCGWGKVLGPSVGHSFDWNYDHLLVHEFRNTFASILRTFSKEQFASTSNKWPGIAGLTVAGPSVSEEEWAHLPHHGDEEAEKGGDAEPESGAGLCWQEPPLDCSCPGGSPTQQSGVTANSMGLRQSLA